MSLLSDAAAELYAGELETFTQRRAELAGQARAVGDKAGAKSIASLGKPTRAAWVVNRLVRADPSVPDQLAALGDQLRAGEAALDGAHIRELSQRRRQLVDKLVRQALAHSAQPSATAALKEEVTATFNAALADPAVAEQVAAAKLLRPAHWAGFSPGIGTDPGAAPIAWPPEAEQGEADQEHETRRAARAEPGRELQRNRELERKRARQQAIAAARRAVTDAKAAADAAASVQREHAEAVADLEQQLADARQRLRDAEAQARDAASALRKARRALDRLQG